MIQGRLRVVKWLGTTPAVGVCTLCGCAVDSFRRARTTRLQAARMINARSETANTKPAFRDALKSRSRLIAADAFYWGCELENKAAILFRGKRRRFVRVRWNQGPLERHPLFPLSS
jgi:putative SOS response-associated peptidase YedK